MIQKCLQVKHINKVSISFYLKYRQNLHIDSKIQLNATFFQSRGLRCGALPRRGIFVFQKNDLFQGRGLRCGALPHRDVFSLKNDPFPFLDTTFRVNVTQSLCMPSKYRLSEFTRGIPLIPVIPFIRGNGPNRARPDLGSTRAWGNDDGGYTNSPRSYTCMAAPILVS